MNKHVSQLSSAARAILDGRHADPFIDIGKMRGKPSQLRTVREQNREVVQTKCATPGRWRDTPFLVEAHENAIVTVRGELRGARGLCTHAESDHSLVVAD